MDDDLSEFDLDWIASRALIDAPLFPAGDSSIEDWEERYNRDTTGFVPDPLTTSFTDLDLGPARLEAAVAPEWLDEDWPPSEGWAH
jgi:hypothetical protein